MNKVISLFLLLVSVTASANPPELQLANVYHESIDLADYWVSEKYDGVRGYWNGKQFTSRQGNPINAPSWFTEPLPDMDLDGELWIARGSFDVLSGIVRSKVDNHPGWKSVKYMVFDLPQSSAQFDRRIPLMQRIINQINVPYIQMVEQTKYSNTITLMAELDQMVDAGGEGLMLHRGGAFYHGNRNDDLLKLKKFEDAEATVLAYLPGKGKYLGLMGSMVVKMVKGIQFKIGTGFSDKERANPPPIGSIITFKYYGLTANGVPRFASFLRIRRK
ncbi:MAG: DNA ligase-1 [Gammaproteobacteria bacterium]|jgi:DNA ligase-1